MRANFSTQKVGVTMKMIATAYLFLVLAFPVWAEDKTSRDTKYVKAEIYYYGWDILTRNRLSLEFIRQYPKIKTSIIGPFETNSLVEWLISDGMSVASRDRGVTEPEDPRLVIDIYEVNGKRVTFYASRFNLFSEDSKKRRAIDDTFREKFRFRRDLSRPLGQ